MKLLPIRVSILLLFVAGSAHAHIPLTPAIIDDAIDYRDLWRTCRAAHDHECADRYSKLNRNHLEAVSARYADGKTGELARTLLQRFEAEIADGQ